MKIGKWDLDREDISIALMILCAMIAMFYLGYYHAYSKAISYANQELAELTEEFYKENHVNQDYKNFDYNIEIDQENGKERFSYPIVET